MENTEERVRKYIVLTIIEIVVSVISIGVSLYSIHQNDSDNKTTKK